MTHRTRSLRHCVRASLLVPRTRSSHDFAAGTFANFGFKSGARIIGWLVSFSIPKFAPNVRRMLANFGIGTLAAAALVPAQARAQQIAIPVTYLSQNWTDADRDTFYTTGQGSHMMPFAWFKALRQQDSDQPFMADQLARYGYIRNDSAKNANDLPIGFVVETKSGQLGMTCAACHTNQLEYQKDGKTQALRVDGAPTLADFQQFLLDLAAASRATLEDPGRFDTFAKAVLGTDVTPAQAADLKTEFGKWVQQFGDFMKASLPTTPWGPGRLDAFGMIFNRVAARDLGLEHDPQNNFKPADAPVSYPFVWNASRQDRTQWNGGVPNGLYVQALARNTGEVYGVFADFRPRRPLPLLPKVDFDDNSADFVGLQTLEEQIKKLEPPPWPGNIWPIDKQLAERGKALFEANCSRGCHEEKLTVDQTWVTPVLAVGTDPKMAVNAGRKSVTGLLSGTPLPPPKLGFFGDTANTADILAISVLGSIGAELKDAFTQHRIKESGAWQAVRKDVASLLPGKTADDVLQLSPADLITVNERILFRLRSLFQPTPANPSYEARVLRGIWATAPYLHNGSVPSLWELMLPPERRSTTFKVGSRKFDPKNVGYATDETPFKSGTFVVDPQNGNGNGGHDYTKDLSDDDRWAIVEYLKTL